MMLKHFDQLGSSEQIFDALQEALRDGNQPGLHQRTIGVASKLSSLKTIYRLWMGLGGVRVGWNRMECHRIVWDGWLDLDAQWRFWMDLGG